MTEIGRLIDANARSAWANEAHDFTPWLANNLDRLGDEIGLELETEGTEVSVDTFVADILARDQNGDLVLIENQLESTDHKHLGQIMTYLAGLDAKVVIWVATEFRDAHISAISWLNEHTADPFAFFAVRLRVVRIGESLPAPIFDVVARPNNWDRRLQKIARESAEERTEVGERRIAYWSLFLEMFPVDEALGIDACQSSNNWVRPDNNLGLVISVYVAVGSVGVFIRGERGVTPAEINERLAPYREALYFALGPDIKRGDDRDHPAIVYRADMKDRANWEAAIRWQHETLHTVIDAVRNLPKDVVQ